MLPVGWAALILALTSVPGSAVPDVGVQSGDKLVHLLLYGVLGALALRSVRDPARPLRSVLIVTLAVSCFGALDELHQFFVPGRSADFIDWLADSIGGITGAVLVAATARGGEEAA